MANRLGAGAAGFGLGFALEAKHSGQFQQQLPLGGEGGAGGLGSGGGITARSNPAAEYEESLTKIKRIMEAFRP